MKEYKTKSEIEDRLRKIDEIETHIWFSAEIMTIQESEKLREIRIERAELKEQLKQFK